MFIRAVDDSLEAWVRAALPMPAHVGDITFEQPSGNWSSRLSRLTVNLYLYDVSLSNDPPRAITQRLDENGRLERRPPQPMIRLCYLVSAWAGASRDEHELLGDVVSILAGATSLPAEHLSPALQSGVSVVISADPDNRLREIWGAVGGQLKASFTLQATVAADTFDWSAAPPAVERIESLLGPMPRSEAAIEPV